jgi:DNA-binding NtrC family response regulator
VWPSRRAGGVPVRIVLRIQKFLTMRVLVVEDELLIRWSIAQTLADAAHMVIEAEDAAGAMAAVKDATAPVDAVLLDYRLPDSDDLSLLANIRRFSPRSAVILMTAHGTPDLIKGAIDLGAYTVMNKPFDMQDLIHVLVKASGSCTD